MFFDTKRLPESTQRILRTGDSISISAVSIYEIGQKVRLRKLPEMDEGKLDLLISESQGVVQIIPIDTVIFQKAALMDWPHRDPFDRFLAATSILHDTPIISRDMIFDTVNGLQRIWESIS